MSPVSTSTPNELYYGLKSPADWTLDDKSISIHVHSWSVSWSMPSGSPTHILKININYSEFRPAIRERERE